jgi:hypothetical protein
MDKFENLTPEGEQYQPPTPFANVFGENVVEDGYTAPQDQPGPPGPDSSARRIHDHRDRQRAATAAARVHEELDRAAALEADAAAYDRAIADRLAGREPDPRDVAAAVRHGKRAGTITPRSSAKIIEDRARGRGPQPVTTSPAPTHRGRRRGNPDVRRALLRGRGSTGR